MGEKKYLVKSDPLVSVIMNCHNGEEFLKEAIDSIYSQIYTNWEIIFWDNASSDLSSSIANSYDDCLKYFKTDRKSSLGEARNLACKKANGKYLAFLDVDDIWYPNKLKKQVDIFESSDVELSFVYGRSEILNEVKNTKHTFRENEDLPEGSIFKELLKEDFIPFCSSMINRKKFYEVGGFPSHFNHSTDYWLFLHLSQKYMVGVLQEVCCVFRIHQNNLSNSQHLICAKENIELISKFSHEDGGDIGLKYQYVNLSLSYIIEKKYFSTISVLIKYGGWGIFFNKILIKILR